VLRAIANVGDHHENRLAALLTCFFQRHPIPLNPEVELSPESEFSKLLADLQELAALRRWGQLFAELQQRTHIATTLVRLADGERKLADLRQVSEYCIEQLVSCNWTLAELQEHLGALLAERVHVSKDKNQFTQASANSAVKVLTMHASKGLEFPVVFVIPTSSRTSASTADIRSWIDPHDGKLHLLLETSDFRLEKPNEFIYQDIQERLRLLYVALTRPQVMLFLPLYLACEPPKDHMGAWSWSEAQLPKSSAEKELSPRLKDLLATSRLHAFDEAEWQRRERIKPSTPRDSLDPHWSPAADPVLQAELSELSQRLRELGLSKRKSLQTSYTELSHDLESERELGAAEEPNEPVAFEESALPRGKDTGDALHSVLEECIEAADWKLVPMRARLRASLERNRVLQRIPTEPGRELALDAACKMVQQGMQCSYDMGPWGKFSLAELKANALLGNCRAELEFQLVHHLESAPHLDWLHGFMDVVCRISDPANAKHPWRYHVLDWKTNSLPVYDRAHIEASIVVSHYDLQAKVYAHALHKFLQGLLGESYDPSANLGAAVYVYLRAFEHNDTVEVWWHNSNPSSDAEFVAARIDAWKKGRQ
jgi:exodeoxyribonuclease V beta subunit